MSSSDLASATLAGSELPDDAPALVVTEIGTVALERRPVPKPEPGEVLVRTRYSGVSIGTELWMATGKMGSWEPKSPGGVFPQGHPFMPFVPGYQAVGEVVALGDDSQAAGIAVGEVVACFASGTHQRYVVADVELTHRVELNERLPTMALFVQPGVGANALGKAGVQCGDSVMVVGQGLIGQATAQLARLRGAYVIGTEISRERLKIAAMHCVDRIVDASIAPPSEQIVDQFPDGVDVVIESTGLVSLVDDAMKCVRREGTFVFEGYYPDGLAFDFSVPHRKQIRAVFPNFIGDRDCRESVLRLLTNGMLDLQPLISDLVSWQDAVDTYRRLFTSERDHLNGVVFDWSGAQ